jgi:hypothetical protein
MQNLTDISSLLYLLSSQQKGEKMKGSIRPISRQRKCPACNKPFQHIQKLGYLCPSCKTTPNRFFIDLFYNGQRIQICSDKTGQALDSYQRALKLQSHIQTEIDNHVFDSTKYIKSELKEFYIMTLIDRFLKFKGIIRSNGELNRENDNSTIAPSYRKDYKRMLYIAKGYFKTLDVRELRKRHITDYHEYLKKKAHRERVWVKMSHKLPVE